MKDLQSQRQFLDMTETLITGIKNHKSITTSHICHIDIITDNLSVKKTYFDSNISKKKSATFSKDSFKMDLNIHKC